MSVFAPVTTLEDLDSLNDAELLEGYQSAERGDPEPGENRGRSFWHGWRCRMFDYGVLKAPPEHAGLARDWVKRERERHATN